MADEINRRREIGELSIAAFEEALDSGTGWSTVSRRRTIAMASVIALLDQDRLRVGAEGQDAPMTAVKTGVPGCRATESNYHAVASYRSKNNHLECIFTNRNLVLEALAERSHAGRPKASCSGLQSSARF